MHEYQESLEDGAAVCEGIDPETGNGLYVVDCQLCGVIVDTLPFEAHSERAQREHAQRIAVRHNDSDHRDTD